MHSEVIAKQRHFDEALGVIRSQSHSPSGCRRFSGCERGSSSLHKKVALHRPPWNFLYRSVFLSSLNRNVQTAKKAPGGGDAMAKAARRFGVDACGDPVTHTMAHEMAKVAPVFDVDMGPVLNIFANFSQLDFMRSLLYEAPSTTDPRASFGGCHWIPT